ncbi:hypothetical protein COV16_03055 [Candidatus Woesearchaeota archaeon CG10_big_fil_rev_8_21_14_0_10_34_8]|nr:MAG: hypothetical protein COV16_03055 [Candidatus Woesearchaeota archaeon CG10_big_fil_rev_8_21_14_0_10_34_8]
MKKVDFYILKNNNIKMRQLVFLGTGNGMPISSSCTSILVEDTKNNILLDTGGGHDILTNFHKLNRNPTEVNNIFITHYDSDHILGIIPLVRTFHKWEKPRKRRIFCSKEVKKAIDSLFKYVAKKHYEPVKETLEFVILKHGMEYGIGKWKLKFFNIKSRASPQFGCTIVFPDKTKLAFLGDEPLREYYHGIVMDSDVLIHEAFCLDKDQDIFKPHAKNHCTVKEAAQNAALINAKKLALFHMEDRTLKTRKKKYATEAKKYFNGNIFVPVDCDTFSF